MNLPHNISEADFLRITSDIANLLFPKFGTIHASLDDFSQEVVIWSIHALAQYDQSRPLGAYLYRNSKNRAINCIRDRVSRLDHPCHSCHSGNPCSDGSHCARYAKWLKRNNSKACLYRPLGLHNVSENESRAVTNSIAEAEVEARELRELIERELPVAFREPYLSMLAGHNVKPTLRNLVRRAVADILNDPPRGADSAKSRCDQVVLGKWVAA